MIISGPDGEFIADVSDIQLAFLGDVYASDKNAGLVWYAIQICIDYGFDFPDWVKEYLKESAASLMSLSAKTNIEPANISDCLQLSGKGGPSPLYRSHELKKKIGATLHFWMLGRLNEEAVKIDPSESRKTKKELLYDAAKSLDLNPATFRSFYYELMRNIEVSDRSDIDPAKYVRPLAKPDSSE